MRATSNTTKAASIGAVVEVNVCGCDGVAEVHAPLGYVPDVLRMIDHEDFSVIVKNRAPPPKPWQWEIYRAGRNSAIERSKSFFATATEAKRAGKVALRLLLSEYP